MSSASGPNNSTAFETSLARLLLQRCADEPDRILLSADGRDWSVAELATRAEQIAAFLRDQGLTCGGRIAVMLDNHAEHAACLLALGLIGAVWVPVNTRFTAANIAPLLERTVARIALADWHHADTLRLAHFTGKIFTAADLELNRGMLPPSGAAAIELPRPDDVRAILFTSGTTGAPKGVIVTERMFMAAGQFAGRVSSAGPDERYFMWEPLHHIGGAQMLPMALMTGARLAMVPRFSASTFWSDVRAAGATRIHYLGGVLDILLKQPADPLDRAHDVRIGFGAGAKASSWRDFEARFGLRLVEVFGMTEASSFSTANLEGVAGAIGRALPEFEIALLDEGGEPTMPDDLGSARGEIALRATPPGLITPGYLDDIEATARSRHGDWFLTGDLARQEADGNLYYCGRKKEAIRCRGENVSAWEVEQVLNGHPEVIESAVVGVAAEIGEEDILAYLRPRDIAGPPEPQSLIDFCSSRLAGFQIPRYFRFVTDFERTPTERIARAVLSRDPAGAFDRVKKGARRE